MEKILLKDKLDRQWIFYLKGGNLCYSINGEKEQILSGGVSESFDIITDEAGNFNLVFQESNGNLICLIYDFTNWKKYVILKSKSNANRITDFKLFIEGKRTHCIYILHLNEKAMLVHHIFGNDTHSAPNAIAYIDSSKGFSCAMDESSDIHIFYFDDKDGLTYKIYTGKSYEDKKLAIDDEIKSITTIFENKLHMVYTAKMKAYCITAYHNIETGEKKIVGFGDGNMSDINVFAYEKNIVIQWREKTRYYQCISTDGGLSFKKPTAITYNRNKKPELFRLRVHSNPRCFKADRCIAITGAGTTDILIAERCTGALQRRVSDTSNNLKSQDYNIIDGDFFDKLSSMQNRIRKNENEIARLNTIIKNMSDKISSLTTPLITKKDENVLPKPDSVDIGEINTDNYEFFKKTDIDSINFDNSEKF